MPCLIYHDVTVVGRATCWKRLTSGGIHCGRLRQFRRTGRELDTSSIMFQNFPCNPYRGILSHVTMVMFLSSLLHVKLYPFAHAFELEGEKRPTWMDGFEPPCGVH